MGAAAVKVNGNPQRSARPLDTCDQRKLSWLVAASPNPRGRLGVAWRRSHVLRGSRAGMKKHDL